MNVRTDGSSSFLEESLFVTDEVWMTVFVALGKPTIKKRGGLMLGWKA